jgi:hypothetical protein
MNGHGELGDLRKLWCETVPPGLDVTTLRHLVDKQTRQQTRTMISLALLSVAVLVFGLWRAIYGQSPQRWITFTFATTVVALSWVGALWLHRATKAPRDESTAAYLDVAIRRSRAAVLAAPFGISLYLVGLGIAVWIRVTLMGQEFGATLRSGPILMTGVIILPLYSAFMGANALIHHRRLQRLRALQQALAST